MSKIKNIIIILIIIILIIVLSIVLLLVNSKKENIVDEDTEGDVGEVLEITNQMEDVKDISTFKTVEQIIQRYYNIIDNQSSIFYERNEDGEYTKINDTKIKQIRLSLLSEEYIKNNNISTSNIYQYMNTVEKQGTVIALKMKELINTNVDKYLVQGIFVDFNYDVLDEFYIIVNLDTGNQTFSVEPILKKYDDINQINVSNNNEIIEANDNNKYNNELYNYEDIAKSYFLTYKRLALSAPNILYNFFGTEYRDKRFGEENVFVKYVEENKNEIQGLKLTQYLVNNKQDVTQFVCKDQYENVYIFDQTLPMQFTLSLDNYTIMTDKFRETYENTSAEEKVKMNIDKFIQMINRHDYISSYKCISEGFKNNYFDEQEKFESFIKNNFFSFNNFEFKNIEKKGDDIFVCTVQLTDLTDENSEARDINIIMKINDNFDFEMSFAV